MTFRTLFGLVMITAGAVGASLMGPSCEKAEATPSWLEADSAAAIQARIAHDFSLTYAQAVKQIRELHPEVTDEDIRSFVKNHYIETRVIDGQTMVHRKSPRNLALLCPAMFADGRRPARGEQAGPERIAYVDSVLAFTRGENPLGAAHEVTYTFSVAVPYDPALDGDTLRVWMPVPLATQRQTEPEILATSQPDYVVSHPEQSVHHTIYMTAPAPQPGDTARFSYTARFVTRGQYFAPADILARMKPYDKEGDIYRTYTAFEAPHIIDMTDLAREIVGDETNPYLCSEAVYDYIITNYPWAGAREYSTIECIPQYVIDEGHGDCGQVALLYISLMRSLGIPARWESGWMLHPGEVNLHDWAEVYLEGVGWVPVDASFGRYTQAADPAAVKFYSTGMDAHRFVSNQGVCGKLYPPKKYLRSETVDFQLGEVECSQGNLFYPGWDSDLELIEVKPVAVD